MIKLTRLSFAVILGMALLSCRVCAQEDYVGEATSALQDVLVTLKQSAEKLSVDNDRLADRDHAMQQQVSQLRAQLERLEAQGELLSKTAAQSRDKDQSRAQQPGPQEGPDHQIEKLKLMKMIYDSQQRQESLQNAILEMQKNTPLKPPPVNGQWDEVQLYQLEVELKTLERNYLQFKNLVEQMGKKNKAARLTDSQRVEQDKLQSTIDDLNRQGVGLKADLDDLRSQMIDLDKRKSRLEMTIQQLP